MISRVQIKNYKCYGEPGVDFRLKRVNFVFGDNSAGKSTFLQLIRMAFNNETDKVDSDFSSYVFKGDTSRTVKMRVAFSECPNGRQPVYEYSKKAQSKGVFDYVGWTMPPDSSVTRAGKDVDCDRVCKEWSKEHWPHVVHSEAARPERFLDSKMSGKSSLTESAMLGSDAVEYANKFFKALNLPYLCKDRTTLTDRTFGISVLRRNVGAGIDGLYETALQLCEWHKEKNGILALEEPEAHVNERQISSFMNLLFDEVMDGGSRQLIVECHNELMALKLKNLVRSGKIVPDELAVLFATKMEDGSVCRRSGNGRKRELPQPLAWGGDSFR